MSGSKDKNMRVTSTWMLIEVNGVPQSAQNEKNRGPVTKPSEKHRHLKDLLQSDDLKIILD